MAKDGDEVDCVVMGRESPSKGYDVGSLIVITKRKSVAWRSAHAIQAQQQRNGDKKYEAKVILLVDFEEGRYKSTLKPPPGFNLEYA